MKHQTKIKRYGWTLVELLVAISVLSILLATTTVVITTIMRQEKIMGKRFLRQAARGRLADQFRSDVHAAVSVQWGSEMNGQAADTPIQCRLLDGQTIQYRVDGNRVVRRSDNVNHLTAYESYAVPTGTALRLDVESIRAAAVVPDSDSGGASTFQNGASTSHDLRPPLQLATLILELPVGHKPAGSESSPSHGRRPFAIQAIVGRDLQWMATTDRVVSEDSLSQETSNDP